MPVFFFDINGTADEIGIEFESRDLALADAQSSLSALAGDVTLRAGEAKGWFCIIRDADGADLSRVSLAMFVEDLDVPPGTSRIFHSV